MAPMTQLQALKEELAERLAAGKEGFWTKALRQQIANLESREPMPSGRPNPVTLLAGTRPAPKA